jgi:erythronate-4-phosphate dehydrogenase
MIKVVVDDKIPYLKGVLEPYAQVIYLPGSKITTHDLIDADALLTRTRTKCNAKLLEGTNVKFIATATIGFDHIDTKYCDENGIKWTNAPGCNSGSVQQFIASTLLHLAVKHKLKLSEIVLGVVGVGNVGTKVVKLAEALGITVLLNDPPRAKKEGNCGFVSLDSIIRECNIITFHVPLNKDGDNCTYHLADSNFLAKLQPNTILINSSRGEVVDNIALKAALKEKSIKAAILDVWENEPDIDNELLKLVDFGTPHIAGYSYDGKANGTAMSVQALSKFFNLPLIDWSPNNIEKPPFPEITINCEGLTKEEVLFQSIIATYDIKYDDNKLRDSIETFEKQRGDYAIRREFHAYKIHLLNDKHHIQNILKEIGFKG